MFASLNVEPSAVSLSLACFSESSGSSSEEGGAIGGVLGWEGWGVLDVLAWLFSAGLSRNGNVHVRRNRGEV